MLKIENLTKSYGKFKAVDSLSLEIEKGHIYGFVGANGAGKTTTMKVIAGLIRQSSGNVFINGEDISKLRAYKKKIGYMPDFFGVYDDLKVTEYLEFYAGIQNIKPLDTKIIINQLLELVSLSDKKDAYVDSLSRGMKQRLCLARAIIHDPDLIILDEPASGLDPKARVDMKEILKELKSMGKTILISSHILPELAELCTSIGIIDHGKMVISGTVDEIMKAAKYTRSLVIKTTEDYITLSEILKQYPEVGQIQINSDFLEADFGGSDQDMARLLKNIINSGISVFSFSEKARNLESMFMQLVGGQNNAD